MRTLHLLIAATFVLGLTDAADAQKDGRSQFFNPFSVDGSEQSKSWLTSFNSSSTTTSGLRGSSWKTPDDQDDGAEESSFSDEEFVEDIHDIIKKILRRFRRSWDEPKVCSPYCPCVYGRPPHHGGDH